MKSKHTYPGTGKFIVINLLFFMSGAIMLSGIFFAAYSILNNISIKVLNTNVPGIVFGMIVAYLGLRYFMMVPKLKSEVYKNGSRFSWSNFRPRRLFAKSKS